jgi:hypothetical protein
MDAMKQLQGRMTQLHGCHEAIAGAGGLNCRDAMMQLQGLMPQLQGRHTEALNTMIQLHRVLAVRELCPETNVDTMLLDSSTAKIFNRAAEEFIPEQELVKNDTGKLIF